MDVSGAVSAPAPSAMTSLRRLFITPPADPRVDCAKSGQGQWTEKYPDLQLIRSLNHLVRHHQQRLRNVEAQRFGGLAVDHQFKNRGLLDGQVGRFSALENLVHI